MKRISNRWAHSLSFMYDLKSLRNLYEDIILDSDNTKFQI